MMDSKSCILFIVVIGIAFLNVSCDFIRIQNPFLSGSKAVFFDARLVMNGKIEGETVDIDKRVRTSRNAHNYYRETGISNIIFENEDPYYEIGIAPFDTLKSDADYTLETMGENMGDSEVNFWIGSHIYLDKYGWKIYTLGNSSSGTIYIEEKNTQTLKGTYDVVSDSLDVSGSFSMSR